MKKITLLILLFPTCHSSLFAQNSINLSFGLGYSFQNKTASDQSGFYDTDALGSIFGVTYQVSLSKKIMLETGLIGKYNRGIKETELVNFVSHNFRVQVPLYFGIKVSEKILFNAGIGIENNRDFKNINLFNKDHNLRLDFLTKIDFLLSEKISINLYSNWSASNSPDLYSIGSPDNGIFIGTSYKFN